MFQRSSTYVLSTKYGVTTLFGRKPSCFPTVHCFILIRNVPSWRNLEYYSENGPPVDVGDRLNASFPNYFAKLLHQRLVHVIAEKDKCVVHLLFFSPFTWLNMVDSCPL